MHFQPNGYIKQIALIQASPAGYWLCYFACGLRTAKAAHSEQSVKYCCAESSSQADRMRNGCKGFTTLLSSTIPSSLLFLSNSAIAPPPHSRPSILPSRPATYSSCSLPPPSLPTHPTSLLSSIFLTSPELRGIQDRQVAVVTGRAGIFYIFFILFFFFKEREEKPTSSCEPTDVCDRDRQKRTSFGFRG